MKNGKSNGPISRRIFSHPQRSHFDTGGGMGNAYAMMLGLVPYPKEYVKMPSGRFGTIRWLMQREQVYK